MREKILAAVILVTILVAVVANTLVLRSKIDDIIAKVEDIKIAENVTKDEAEAVFEDFMQKQKYFSLSVSHEDMTNIEDSFTELVAYLEIGNLEEAEVAKSRLIHSLEHLGRLSGFNIESII